MQVDSGTDLLQRALKVFGKCLGPKSDFARVELLQIEREHHQGSGFVSQVSRILEG